MPGSTTLVHLNGALVPADQARVSVFDRGFVFGDGVYEGLRVAQGRVIALDKHVRRLRMGLDEARIEGFDADALGNLTSELCNANGLEDAGVYWQVTRGTPPEGAVPRSRLAPPGTRPTVFGFATPIKSVCAHVEPEVRSLSVRPDTRWQRGHLKSISLMGGIIASIEAHEHGCDDAVLVRDGLLVEGTATNVFIAQGGAIVTPSLESAPMLEGATRALILGADPSIQCRPVTEVELRAADEVMLAGTYTMIVCAGSLDGQPVGGGRVQHPGPAARRLLRTLKAAIDRDIHSLHAPAR